MAQIDKIKEDVGWLKIFFALLVAIDVSLIGWTSQNFFKLPIWLSGSLAILVLCFTAVIIIVNQKAYKKINQLGKI